MTELPTYVLAREFDAPRELVWRTWTEPELLKRWYGPNVETVVHCLDVRVGGLWLNEMKRGENSNHQRAEFVEVVAPERLVMLMSNTDGDWNIKANPMMPDWPRTLLTTVTFAAAGERTSLHLTWVPHQPTDNEIACFAGAIPGLDKGWAKGMALLGELLGELKDKRSA